MRVIVVEDDLEVRSVLTEYLRGAGHDVVATASGREAQELVSAEGPPFEVAIVDWNMPGISGRDLIEFVNERSPSTLIFLSTGLPESLASDRLTSVPLAGIWRKPFSLRWMLRELTRVVGQTTPTKSA